MMQRLRDWVCRVLGYCKVRYRADRDPLVQRYAALERAVAKESRQYWRPGDAFRL
jgi:hypothetical protein